MTPKSPLKSMEDAKNPLKSMEDAKKSTEIERCDFSGLFGVLHRFQWTFWRHPSHLSFSVDFLASSIDFSGLFGVIHHIFRFQWTFWRPPSISVDFLASSITSFD